MNTNTNTNTTAAVSTQNAWRGIFLRGPQPVKTNDGREVSAWSVYQGDSEGKPAGRVYEIKDFARAEKLAQDMSSDRRLELINEATEVAVAA